MLIVLAPSLALAQLPELGGVLEALRNASVDQAIEEMTRFASIGAESYGLDALPVIEEAANAENEVLQSLALASLWRLGSVDSTALTNTDVMRRAEELLLQSPSAEVTLGAARVLALSDVRTGQPKVHQALLERASDQGLSASSRALLIQLLPNSGEAEDQLLELARSSTPEIAYEAAMKLSRQEPPPPSALPITVALVQTPRHFAEVNLVRAVLRYGEIAEPYVPILEAVKSVLEYERSLPSELRTVNITWQPDGVAVLTESDGMIATLELVIEQLSKKSLEDSD